MIQQKIFQPKYQSNIFSGYVCIVVLEIGALWSIFTTSEKSAGMIFAAAIFGLLALIMPFALIKRIKFEDNSFIVEKYLLPPRTINYGDVIDISEASVKTRQGSIAIRSMANSEELTSWLRKLIREGKINSYQLENKLVRQAEFTRRAVMPSVVIASVFWLAFFFFVPSGDSLFRDLSFLIFWVPTYLLVYRFMKDKAENE